MSIPPPSNVAQVWLLSDDGLAVHFPADNDGRGHTVQLSADIYGLTCLMTILRERRQAQGTIGTASAPSQWDIERAIKKIKLTVGEAKPAQNLTREDREVFRRAEEIERRKAAKHRASLDLLSKLGMI